MPFDRVLRWTGRTLLAMAVGTALVVACSPETPDPPPDDAIQVAIKTVGPGTVLQPSSGFSCRGDCTWTGPADEATGFIAAPDGVNAFVAWTGACHALDANCTRLLNDGDATTATFAPHALRLRLTGDGEGEFRIQGSTIDFGCTEDCAVGLPHPLSLAITYFAHGSTETVLDDWGGACADADRSDYCLVNANGVTDVSKTWRRPPVAFDEVYATTRNAPLSVSAEEGVLLNVIDTPGDSHTAEQVTNVANGTLVLAPDGGFGYTPNPGFAGNDTFTYRARDAFGNLSNTATVTLTVTNRPPEAVGNSYFTALNTPLTVPAPGVLANDLDPDGDALTIVDPTPVTSGTLVLQPDGGFTFTPEPDFFNGFATFTYRASDGLTTSDPATVTIGVGLDAPVAADDAYETFRNQLLTVDAEGGVLANDVDPEGVPLVAILVAEVSHGTLELEADGSFTYAPNPGYTGTDTFTYVASNGTASSVVATATINVGNRAPTAVNDPNYTTTRNATLTVAAPGVLANDSDPDGDSLTANLVTNVSNGNLILNTDGSFSYTPNPGHVGTDAFTYRANDGLTNSNTATATITVSNRAPVANDDSYATFRNQTLTVTTATGLLANDTDPDGDPLTVSSFTQPTNGTVTVGTTGSFTYDPDPGYVGNDSFSYTATDDIATSNTATVSITVTNRAPVANDDEYSTGVDAQLVVPEPGVLANDSDPDNDPLIVSSFTQPSNGTVTVGTNGSFTYDPDPGHVGNDSFSYTVTDGLTTSNTATVTITVGGP